MKILNLIRERKSDEEVWVDNFTYEDTLLDPEGALRSAVNEYLETEDGKKAIIQTCNDFNWGDAVSHVPDEIWKKYGLTMLSNNSIDIIVNQDEVLCN